MGKWLRMQSSHPRLGPSHPRRGFSSGASAAIQDSAVRPVCGFCPAQQLILIFVASHQKYTAHGIGPILVFTLDTWYRPIRARAWGGGESYSSPISKLADLNEDDTLKLMQLQTIFLLLWSFFFFFYPQQNNTKLSS